MESDKATTASRLSALKERKRKLEGGRAQGKPMSCHNRWSPSTSRAVYSVDSSHGDDSGNVVPLVSAATADTVSPPPPFAENKPTKKSRRFLSRLPLHFTSRTTTTTKTKHGIETIPEQREEEESLPGLVMSDLSPFSSPESSPSRHMFFSKKQQQQQHPKQELPHLEEVTESSYSMDHTERLAENHDDHDDTRLLSKHQQQQAVQNHPDIVSLRDTLREMEREHQRNNIRKQQKQPDPHAQVIIAMQRTEQIMVQEEQEISWTCTLCLGATVGIILPPTWVLAAFLMWLWVGYCAIVTKWITYYAQNHDVMVFRRFLAHSYKRFGKEVELTLRGNYSRKVAASFVLYASVRGESPVLAYIRYKMSCINRRMMQELEHARERLNGHG